MLVFPVKSSVLLYFDRKPRACQQLGNSPGASKCPAPGHGRSWRTDALVDYSLLMMPKIIEIG